MVDAFEKIEDRADLDRVVSTLNRFCLVYPFPQDLFVSLIYAVIDPVEGIMTYVNGGHHPPLLVRDDEVIELPDTGGMALNIFDMPYETKETELDSQDCLIFFTDGIIEAAQARENGAAFGKELFGKDRLEQAILKRKVHQTKTSLAVDQILSAAHDEGFEIEDDITIQVYRHV